MAELKIPTETVSLPSKGLLYPETSPLAKGQIEMKYMTAKEEDILSNANYIRQGTVIDKLLQALIVTPIDYNELLIGDKNAILIAARVLGYGKDYSFTYENEEITVDLSELPSIDLDESIITKGINSFKYTLPATGTEITYKLLTGRDEKTIDSEVKGIKRINKNVSPELSTKLKHQIIAVDGEEDKKTIRDFVDNYFLAKDSAAFRTHIKQTSPDIKMTFIHNGANGEEEVTIPLQIQFFWPDARV
jgi:hypothetical protein